MPPATPARAESAPPLSRRHHLNLYAVSVTDTRPRYRQIADSIAASIAAGDLPVGSVLPSKRALAEREGVSMGTAEHAVGLLCEWGLAETRQGLGTFVVAARPAPKPKTLEERIAALEAWREDRERGHGT